MQIVLHGLLSHLFEKKVQLDSEIEKSLVVDFLNSRHRNFKTSLKKMAKEGNFYEIIESSGNLHIVPIVGGSIGAVAGALGSQLVGQFVMGAVTNVAMVGIMQLITPGDEDAFEGLEDAVVLQSTRFQGLQNVAAQGNKVPVGYGRLKIGSQIVNQYSENVNTDNSNNISEIKDVFGEDGYDSPTSDVGVDNDEYLNVLDGVIVGSYDAYDDDDSYEATDGSNIEGEVSDVIDLESGLPVITSSREVQELEIDAPFTYVITATRNPTRFSAVGPLDENGNLTGLPNGLSLNSSTGLISGSINQGGIYKIFIFARNEFGTSGGVLITLVVGSNNITSANTISTIKGEELTYTITSDMSPAADTFNAVGYANLEESALTDAEVAPLPAGLSVNTSTGVITGPIAEVGTFKIIVSASNSTTGLNGSLVVTINSVNLITSATEAVATVGSSFTYTITTVDSKADTFDVANLPAGLSINTSTGVISGIPTTVVTEQEVTVFASRSASPTILQQSQIVLITVAGAAVPIITSPRDTINSTIGDKFDPLYEITAINQPQIFIASTSPRLASRETTLTLVNGVPTSEGLTPGTIFLNLGDRVDPFDTNFETIGMGLKVNTSTGNVFGQLSASSFGDVFPIYFTASNEFGTSSLAGFLLRHSPLDALLLGPKITSFLEVRAEHNDFQLIYTITADEEATFEATNLNQIGPDVVLDPRDGTIRGTPTDVGVFEVIIRAISVAEGRPGPSKKLRVIVEDQYIIIDDQNQFGVVGQPAEFSFGGFDGPDAVYHVSGSIPGVVEDGTIFLPEEDITASGGLTGIPTKAGIYRIVISGFMVGLGGQSRQGGPTSMPTSGSKEMVVTIFESNFAVPQLLNAINMRRTIFFLGPSSSLRPVSNIDLAAHIFDKQEDPEGEVQLETMAFEIGLFVRIRITTEGMFFNPGAVGSQGFVAEGLPPGLLMNFDPAGLCTTSGITFQNTNNVPDLKVFGEITGRPTEEGTFTVKITPRNLNGEGPFAEFNIEIVPRPVATSDFTAIQASVGDAINYTFTASNDPVEFYAANLPKGISIAQTTTQSATGGQLTGTFQESGTFEVILQAVDERGAHSVPEILQIIVAPSAPKFLINENLQSSSFISEEGVLFESLVPTGVQGKGLTIFARNQPTSITATGLPPGLSIQDTASTERLIGTIFGTPTATGTFTVTVTATNSSGSDVATITLEII